jgi:hypothetical protein
MSAATTETHTSQVRHVTRRPSALTAAAARPRRAGRPAIPPAALRAREAWSSDSTGYAGMAPGMPALWREVGRDVPTLDFALPTAHRATPRAAPAADPAVWVIALPTGAGGWNSLEGVGRVGPIRASRPYGHLRAVRPVTLDSIYGASSAIPAVPTAAQRPERARGGHAHGASLGSATAGPATMLPAKRPLPPVVSAVEVETDAAIFRVERPNGVLTHSDMAWALAHLEAGEPDSVVALPRRQLALLLTLLPTPEDPEHPELDPTWGWAHRLRGPWERGPLHTKGKLGRFIAFDPDQSGAGMHRACFELLGAEEVVWAIGVPCFLTGSVYELVPIGKGLQPSRWLTWPLAKGRKRAGAIERPRWEIARVVYRVGAPRWPLAGVVEPLGPMGVAG